VGQQLKVAVIGAGFAGIATARALKREGFEDFVVLERSAGPGGTWWDNHYPGAEVDSPSHMYSFSFLPNDWTRTHARQPELQAYMERAIREEGLTGHFRFGVTVRSLTWDDDAAGYHVETDDETVDGLYHGVISAVGFFNTPNIPAWATSSDFRGQVFHSSRWPHDLDLRGKRVGVVGVGSTALQVVSETAKVADRVLVFQREPNWIIPKGDRDLTLRQRRRLRRRIPRTFTRFLQFLSTERERIGGRHSRAGTGTNKRLAALAKRHLHEALADRPDLIEKMTPHHPFLGKRPGVNDTFYRAIKRENVEVIPYAVEKLAGTGPVDASGTEHAVDVVVLATGFRAAEYLSSLKVTGPGGKDLHRTWAGEPSAFLGICVPGFPNFFMCYGPGTNTSPLVFFFERQGRYAAKSLREMERRGATTVEVKATYARVFDAWMQRRLSRTLWARTDNYFRSESGRVVTQWPVSATFYATLARTLRRPSSSYR
jgi:cyclohexanone monooxygenase